MRKVQRRTTPTEEVAEAVVGYPNQKTGPSTNGKKDPFLGKRHQRVVVGIDASLTGTALCFYDIDTGEYATWRHKPKTRGVQRLIEISQFVYGKCHSLRLTSDEVCMLVMEEYGFAGKGKVFHMGEGGGAVKMALIRSFGSMNKEAYPSMVSPTGLKKFVLGKGQGEKSDMKMQTLKRWNAEFSDDNECDAFALAQVAALLVRGDLAEEAPAYQKEVLAKVDLHAEWPG